jgi:hypothetical protein
MMSELETAYRATTYQVFLPGAACELRIDQPCNALLRWLKDEEVDQFAVITAFNPASELLEPAENLERQSRLEVELLEGGYEPFAGENVPDDPAAPREESCFIADIPLVDALALAAQYGQNAIVHGGADGIPRLAWIGVAETWGKE